MTRVIAAVDNSLAAGPVCRMATAVGPVFDAAVECIHVVEDGDRSARSAASDAGVPFQRLDGDPLDRVVSFVGSEDVAAVVVGAHGRSAVPGPLGHFPIELASRTDRPVVVVPPGWDAPDRIRRVVVAMKGTPARRISLKRAVDLAEARDLEIVVVHVDDEATIPAFSDQPQHETEAYTDEFFARNLPGARHARLELRIGAPVEEILAVARAAGAEVVAVGWPHGDAPRRGEVARELLERCDVPILLVGTGAEAP